MNSADRSSTTVPGERPQLLRALGLWQTTAIAMGVMIGTGIFLVPSDVTRQVGSPKVALAVWVGGGLLSLFGALSFAELAGMMPQAGGQYIYLREAYGGFYGFLFGWMVLFINFSGTVAALAVGFATYGDEVLPYGAKQALLEIGGWSVTRGQVVALLAIAVLTWVNVIGLRRVAVMQNIATWMKFAAIAVFVVLGVAIGKGSGANFTTPAPNSHPIPLLFAVVVALNGVFFAYDGWNYITCAAGEVKNPQRNIPRALVLGVIAVAIIYVSLNVVYLYALPLAQIKDERTIAKAAAITLFAPGVGRWISLLITVSCFGAASACILAGARVVYAMACDRAFFPQLSYVHPRYRTPSLALVVLGAWSGVLALSGKYDELYTYVMFVGVIAYVATVAGVFVLRKKRPDAERPYRCTGYPFVPALYLVAASVWAAIVAYEKPKEAIAGAVIMLIGVPGYVYWRRGANKTG